MPRKPTKAEAAENLRSLTASKPDYNVRAGRHEEPRSPLQSSYLESRRFNPFVGREQAVRRGMSNFGRNEMFGEEARADSARSERAKTRSRGRGKRR